MRKSLSEFSWPLPLWAWATRSVTRGGRSHRRTRKPRFAPDSRKHNATGGLARLFSSPEQLVSLRGSLPDY